MSLRFTPEAAAALRTAIVDARGAGGTAEIFAIGDVRDRHVCAVTITFVFPLRMRCDHGFNHMAANQHKACRYALNTHQAVLIKL